MFQEKVYIKGRKANKNDLISQSTTAEVIGRLIMQGWWTVSSRDFGPSSFTRQASQMLAKIIKPLRALCEREFGKKLDIELLTYGQDFQLELWENDLALAVLGPLPQDGA